MSQSEKLIVLYHPKNTFRDDFRTTWHLCAWDTWCQQIVYSILFKYLYFFHISQVINTNFIVVFHVWFSKLFTNKKWK